MAFFESVEDFLEAGTASSATPSSASTSTSSSSGTATSRPSGAATPRASPSNQPAAPASSSSSAQPAGKGFSLDRLMPYIQKGWDFVRFGKQLVQQFRGARSAPAQPAPAAVGQPPAAAQPAGPEQPAAAPQPAAVDTAAPTQPSATDAAGVVDRLTQLLQALRDRQIPALPGAAPEPAVAVPAPAPAPAAAPQPDGLALLRMIIGNPQLLQALQPAAPRTVSLAVPGTSPPNRIRSIDVPVGAVINALSALTGQTMTELNAETSEDDPEVPSYLVSDDGDFIVDPTSPERRAALIGHLFRMDAEARRLGEIWQSEDLLSESDDELDECDQWARDAGFMR